MTPEEHAAIEARHQEVRARDQTRYEQLRHQAQAVYRAFDGWPTVPDSEAWDSVSEEARQAYFSGRFLIERLGAERYVDPHLMATLWNLRQQLLADVANPTTADCLLVDVAILAYYNALRVQGWIGNLALHVEHELFGQSAPAVKMGKSGTTQVLAVEDSLKRLGEQMLPLLDRANKMMVRNLKAIRELRQTPMPAVAIGRAEQVNVAEQQVNAVLQRDSSACLDQELPGDVPTRRSTRRITTRTV